MPQFNTFQFNRQQYNGGASLATVYSTDRIVFDSFSLSDNSIMISEEILDSGPTRDLIAGNIPRGDGQYQTAAYFRERTMEVRGIVKQSTAALLDAYLDTIRTNLSKAEANLDITDANSTAKRFIATCDNYETMFAERKGYHITICPFVARFRCKTPFGMARTYTSTAYTGMTTSGTVQSIVNSGTYKASPVFILTFTAASSITGVQIANGTTGETISYTGSAAANDIFIIDSETKSFTKNGTAVDFSGAFPTLSVGANLITTTITGTSFTLDMTSKLKKTYL